MPGVWKQNHVIAVTFPANPCKSSGWAVDLDILPAAYGSHIHTMQICLPQVVSHMISAPLSHYELHELIPYVHLCTLYCDLQTKVVWRQVKLKISQCNMDDLPLQCTHWLLKMWPTQQAWAVGHSPNAHAVLKRAWLTSDQSKQRRKQSVTEVTVRHISRRLGSLQRNGCSPVHSVDFGIIRLMRQTEYKCIEMILNKIVSKMLWLRDNFGTKVWKRL